MLEQSERVTKNALKLKIVENSRGFSVFLSRPLLEVRTNSLIAELLKRGCRVFVPFITSVAERQMEMLELKPNEDVESFKTDKWGIPQLPSPEKRIKASAHDLDVIFTPGVAFDAACNRIGNGKGFYDIYFTKLDDERELLKLPKILKIGLSLNEMITDQVPITETDVPLDFVVTPSNVLSRKQVS